MQAQVIAIEAGSEFRDNRRRITLKLLRGAQAVDIAFDRFRMSEKELGIVGLKLEDIIELAFGCDAVAIREQRRVASRQEGCAS